MTSLSSAKDIRSRERESREWILFAESSRARPRERNARVSVSTGTFRELSRFRGLGFREGLAWRKIVKKILNARGRKKIAREDLATGVSDDAKMLGRNDRKGEGQKRRAVKWGDRVISQQFVPQPTRWGATRAWVEPLYVITSQKATNCSRVKSQVRAHQRLSRIKFVDKILLMFSARLYSYFVTTVRLSIAFLFVFFSSFARRKNICTLQRVHFLWK